MKSHISDKDIHVPDSIDIGVAYNKDSVVLSFNYPGAPPYSVGLTKMLALGLAEALIDGVEKLKKGEPNDLRLEH